MSRYSNYPTLVNIEAVANAIIISVSLIALTQGNAIDLVPPQVLIGTSLIALTYFALIHWIIKKRSEFVSALIMTIISSLNVLLLIIGTGGFESPYFIMWLGVIAVAGLFGAAATGIVTAGSVGMLAFSWFNSNFNSEYLINHIPQLLGILSAAALIEFIYRTPGKKHFVKYDPATKLEKQLHQEAIKADALVNAMAEGVIVTDRKGHITMMNQVASYLTNWSQHDALGLDYHTVVDLKLQSHDGSAVHTDPLTQSIQHLKPVTSSEIVVTSKDGRVAQVALTATAIADEKGQANGAILVMRDITKQKALDREKDEFISTASHEMRTPVAAIEGYLSLLMNPKVATVDDRARNLLEKAHSSTGHLSALFRDLLSITKLEDGSKKLPREAVNLSDMVNSVVADMQFVAASKKLGLGMAGAAPSGTASIPQALYVMANPERLREVIMNLIENAIKYTTTGSVTVAVASNGTEVTFSVTDTGTGIEAEDLPHLFEKFYRVPKTAGKVSGTGLGLYLCRTVVESFGGRIWVESTPGQGSTFSFTLGQLTPEQVSKAQRDKQVLIQPSS